MFDMVFALPEVVEYDAMLADATGSVAIVMIEGMVEVDAVEYYWVKVMEDNGGNFVMNFHFYVNPDRDEAISLAAWRAQG